MTPDPDLPEDLPEDAPVTADEQRDRTSGANRTLAFLLVGGALMMLAAAFAVALVVTHGGY